AARHCRVPHATPIMPTGPVSHGAHRTRHVHWRADDGARRRTELCTRRIRREAAAAGRCDRGRAAVHDPGREPPLHRTRRRGDQRRAREDRGAGGARVPAPLGPGQPGADLMARGRIHDDITQTIGDTPMIRLLRLSQGLDAEVVLKHEGFNPFASVKDRIGVAMVEDGLERGVLRHGMTIVEPTSGNTGIGIAFAVAVHGFRCIFTMPDSVTLERRAMLKALGAEVVLTEGPKGMKQAIARGEAIVAEHDGGAWMPRQFDNPANPDIHYRTTGPEIWEDTQGRVDVLVAGVGTGGTLTGTGRYLKERKPELRVVAVEPVESAVLSGGAPSPHKQQGIGAGFIPAVLDTQLYDEVVQ